MYKYNELTNMRVGRLTAVRKIGRTKDRHIIWECRCDCGNIVNVSSHDLKSKHIQSCGCMRMDAITKHGGRRTKNTERLYGVWLGIRKRCYCENSAEYKWYGGRGIAMCKEWDDYSAFRDWAFSNGYDASAPKYKCTIDRINVNGNYEPKNCRWVDMHVQNTNKRKLA